MASAIYSKASTEITKEERFVGKTTILGYGYGMGAKKFQRQLKGFGVEISEQEASHIIAVYRGTYSLIRSYGAKAKPRLRRWLAISLCRLN